MASKGMRRSPHGERGLKFTGLHVAVRFTKSLSSWRAWIEMQVGGCTLAYEECRSPHGERGLKCASRGCRPASVSVALLMESVD